MATLRNVRLGILGIGVAAVGAVVIGTCGGPPGSPSPTTFNLVGAEPACYIEDEIAGGSVFPPDPDARRQYIVAQFAQIPPLDVRRVFEAEYSSRIRFRESLGNTSYTMSVETSYWSDGLKALIELESAGFKDFDDFEVTCLYEKDSSNRTSPLFLRDRTDLPGHEPPQTTVYVRFYSDVPIAEQREILSDAGVADVDTLDTFNDEWRVTLPIANIPSLQDENSVQWVEPTEPRPEDDANEARNAIGLPEDAANQGDGTVIAQWEVCHPANEHPEEHPDLAGRAQLGLGDRICLKVPQPGIPGGDLPANSHATQVAGLLVGDGSASQHNEGSPNQWRGIAPRAAVVSYSVHDTHSLIKEYLHAAQSAVISSNSWGALFDDYYHREYSTDYAFRSALFDTISSLRNAAGAPAGPGQRMLVVASAGNRGADRDFSDTVNLQRYYWRTVRIRNSAKNVLTVGNVASGESGSVGWPAYDTGRGPTSDGRLKPDLVAPGAYVTAATNPGIMSPVFPSNASSKYYANAWGTSFSTPIVAGAAAMLVTTIRESVCSRNPTPAELRALLIHTAEDLSDASNEAKRADQMAGYTENEYEMATAEAVYFGQAGPSFSPNDAYVLDTPPTGVDALVGPDYVFGYGMVQPTEADAFAENGQFVRASVEKGYVEFPILVSESDLEDGLLRVTLAWDDPPALRGAGPTEETGYLQNDLDLVLVAPDGRRYFPWVLDHDDPVKPAVQSSIGRFAFWSTGTGDHRNTVEQIAIKPPTHTLDRTWRIQVWGNKMSLPPQEFALAGSIIQPAAPCADISMNVVENPVIPPRDKRLWVLFVIAVVVVLLLLLWLAELIYNAYVNEGRRAAILRVTGAVVVLLLIAVLLYNWQIE